MFVIPIGTKASVALKPKLTMGLIAANVIIALVTIPLTIRSEKDLFKVQRSRYASQIKLYLGEYPQGNVVTSFLGTTLDQSLRELEDAKDIESFRITLGRTLSESGIAPEEFQQYEKTLRGRDAMQYIRSESGAAAEFGKWKELCSNEDKIVERSVLSRFGLVPSKMNRVHTFLTHIFLHGGIWHLLGNMLFLWIVGCLLEDSWGRLPFFLFFLAGGVVAGLVYCFQDTSSSMPLVGASGAIAAAMGAFTIRHFLTKIKFFYFLLVFFRPYAGTFYLPAFVFLPFWFATQVVLHYLNGYLGGVSNVAYMAHIGGFSAGILTALAMRMTGFEERFIVPSVQKKQVAAGVLKDPRFEKACGLLQRGNSESALLLFNKLLAERPEDVDLIQDIALLYKENKKTEEYMAFAEKSLKLMILKGSMEDASRLALEMVNARGSIPVNVQYFMRVARWLTDRELYGEAHDVYLSIIASAPTPTVVWKAYVALAKLLSDKMNNAAGAIRTLEETRKLPFDPEWANAILGLERDIRNRKDPANPDGLKVR